MREVWGLRVLSKILIQPRVQGRNPARFKGGYGVPRGFKGEKSKSPPNPLGLAERVPSSADDDSSFSKQQQHNQQLQTHLTVAIPEFLKKNAVFPKNLLHMLHMLHVLHMSGVCRKKKDIRRKSNGFELLPPLRRSPSLEEGGLWGFRRSRPPALPSIEYRGFAVAPITLRAPARRVVITSGINGRAMRAPTGAAVQPTVANASNRCNDATQRCKRISQLQFSATL